MTSGYTSSPHFSYPVVARGRKRRPDKACDRGPRSRTLAVRRGGRRSITQSGRMIVASQQTGCEKCGLAALSGRTKELRSILSPKSKFQSPRRSAGPIRERSFGYLFRDCLYGQIQSRDCKGAVPITDRDMRQRGSNGPRPFGPLFPAFVRRDRSCAVTALSLATLA